MASLRDEIDNCGLFLEQRRRHIFLQRQALYAATGAGKNPSCQSSASQFTDSQAKSAHQRTDLEQVLDAAVQYGFPTGLVKSTTGYKAQ